MPFDTATSPADTARSMIGKRYESNKAFLEGFLLRLGISIQRSCFLEEHLDQVGAWTVHLKDYEISEIRCRTDIRAGDLFLQRKGKIWRAFIVTEHREYRPAYAPQRLEHLGVTFIELRDGIVTEREFSPFQPETHTGSAPNMFRFRQPEAQEQAA